MSLTITNGASTAPIVTKQDDKKSVGEDISSQFLAMLVAQMRNQDPLNPMDNAQMTSQLAQISTVNGITDLNKTVVNLGTNLNAVQSMQGAALVGRTVEIESKTLSLKEGGKATGGFDVPYNVDGAVIKINDSFGREVYATEVGATKAGTSHFEWDGKDTAGKPVEAGEYTFTVQLRANGVEGAANTLSRVQVAAIQPGATGINVLDGTGKAYALANVRQIL